MFYANPAAIPFHVTLHDGSAQISDFGNGFATFNILDSNKLFSAIPGISGSRTVVEQWSLQPVTDDTALKLLQRAYHCALGRPDPFDPDFANDLANELKKQIAVTEDLKNSSRVFYDMQMENALRRHIEHEQLAMAEKITQLSEAIKKELDPTTRDALQRALDTAASTRLSATASAATYGTFDAATQTTSDAGCSICDTEESECIELLICGKNQCRRCPDNRPSGCTCSRLPSVECEECKNGAKCPTGFYELENPLYVRTGATIKWYVPGCDEHCPKQGKLEEQKCPPDAPGPFYVIETCCCDDHKCGEPDAKQRDAKCGTWTGFALQPDPFRFQVMVTKCIPGSVTFSSPSGPEGIAYQIWQVDCNKDGCKCGEPPPKCLICSGRVIVFGALRSPLTVEVCRQVREVKEDISKIKSIQSGWFSVGTCKPKTHCLVGEYSYCGCKYYAWVNEGGQEELSKFTLTVLKFGALLKEAQVVGIAGGVKFFPGGGLNR